MLPSKPCVPVILGAQLSGTLCPYSIRPLWSVRLREVPAGKAECGFGGRWGKNSGMGGVRWGKTTSTQLWWDSGAPSGGSEDGSSAINTDGWRTAGPDLSGCASWMPTWWGFLGRPHQKEALENPRRDGLPATRRGLAWCANIKQV